MSLRSKVIVALRWSAGLRLISQLANWGMTLVVVRLLSPADYGLMSIATVVIAFLAMVNELGVGPALVQRKTVDKPVFQQAFGIALVSNSVLFVIVWISCPALAAFFDEPELIPIIRILSIQYFIIPFAAIPEAILLRNLDFKRKSFIDLVSNVLGGVTSLTLAIFGFGVWSLVLGSLIFMFVRSLGFIVAAPYFTLPRLSLQGAHQLLSFGALITADRLLWFFYSRADVFIIGKLLGTEILGIYSVALQIASLPMQKVNSIINEIAFPAFAQIQENRERVSDYLAKACRIVSFLAFPIFFGISSISPIFVEIVLGEQWTEATLPLAILACVMPLRMMSNIITSTLQGIGRVGISVGNLIFASVLVPPAILIGTQWGIVGISIAWLVVFPLVSVIEIVRSKPYVGLGLLNFAAFMTWPFICSVAMWAAVRFAAHFDFSFLHSVSGLVTIILIGAIVYFLLTIVFNRRNLKETLELART